MKIAVPQDWSDDARRLFEDVHESLHGLNGPALVGLLSETETPDPARWADIAHNIAWVAAAHLDAIRKDRPVDLMPARETAVSGLRAIANTALVA